jgi:squalene synthase HpnC
LADTISQHQLPLVPFFDLLSAFEQDIQTKRYEDFTALQHYCARSANPVGRLMLYLYNQADKASMTQSDAICTALQLINFAQDVALDWQKGRIYLPNNEMQRFGVSPQSIGEDICDTSFKNLMAFQTERCRSLLKSGEPLGRTLSGRIGLELRLIMHGGWRILDLIEKNQYDVFRHRPTLAKSDWAIMLWRGLLSKPL